MPGAKYSSNTPLLVRRLTGPDYYLQSLIGFAFPNGMAWLLSPNDQYVSTCVQVLPAHDAGGRHILMHLFYTFVMEFLDATYPWVTDFEIFRLHFDTFEAGAAEQEVLGRPIVSWNQDKRSGRPELRRVLSYEHLWGSDYANWERLAASFQAGESTRHIHTAARSVALSHEQLAAAKFDFAPHPGLRPVFDSEVEEQLFHMAVGGHGKTRAKSKSVMQ